MTRSKLLVVAGLAVASVAIAASGRAANIGRTDYLTMNRATALPGVVLAPGTYVFDVVEGHADIVRVSERTTRRVVYTGFTDLVRRPDQLRSRLRMGEAPSGAPVPIEAWFPTGSAWGHEFRHR
jgi:hypothetical protein